MEEIHKRISSDQEGSWPRSATSITIALWEGCLPKSEQLATVVVSTVNFDSSVKQPRTRKHKQQWGVTSIALWEGCSPKVSPKWESLRHNLLHWGPASARPLSNVKNCLQSARGSLVHDLQKQSLHDSAKTRPPALPHCSQIPNIQSYVRVREVQEKKQ
ncbi:hypothetical protein V6N11_048423 [Hibiscus sabdariffa]|uniref:Uncharacterized protein n=1 Tax=Hibiscus sabdariffa TaxID=183260 RepID=A0ABR2PVB2_9ROSI